MTAPVLRILGQEIRLTCRAEEEARLRDLADALARRLDALAEAEGGCADAHRILVLAALQLLDEGQRSGAALARARAEIDRLTDLLSGMETGSANDRGEMARRARPA